MRRGPSLVAFVAVAASVFSPSSPVCTNVGATLRVDRRNRGPDPRISPSVGPDGASAAPPPKLRVDVGRATPGAYLLR